MSGPSVQENWKWFDPAPKDEQQPGVLLSDKIQFYAEKIRLVDPFEPKWLGPVSYTLHAGEEYWRDDQQQQLNEKEEIEVPSNGLVYVKIYERLNLPYYLIAQHDLRVEQVHRGFLAGRSLLIDPGYSGHIYYPIYNFTKQDKTIRVGEKLVTICFIRTTHFGSPGFWAQNDAVTSTEVLKRLEVKGLEDNACKVKFPVPDRPMHEYWRSGESHQSSVVWLRQHVDDIEERVNTKIAKIRTIGWVSVGTILLGLLALVVGTWAIVYMHFCWTRDTVDNLRTEMRATSNTGAPPAEETLMRGNTVDESRDPEEPNR